MADYKVTVYGYDSGLNELLNHQEKRYDARTKRMRVYNTEKAKNDKICRTWLLKGGMSKVRIDKPISIHYRFYVKDKTHDRSNVSAAFVKSFEDALQELHIIKNDTYDLVLTPTYYFEVDRKNPRVEVIIQEME